MIEVTDLVKRYGNHTAVDHLSFRVEKGQIYAFLGPNGAGKSTTMNIMTGYIAATEGTVSINGFDIGRRPEEAKRCIGYLPEQPPLYPEMTVKEYLSFAAELKKLSKAARAEAIGQAMEKTQIKDVENRLIRNLSKGYKQRVGFAQAILGSPEIIILDEPTVGLDPRQIIEIRDLIRSLGRAHTVILSSHILSEVSAVCDHILIISNGKLVASDSPEKLAARGDHTVRLEIELLADREETQDALKPFEGQISSVSWKEGEKGSLLLQAELTEDIHRELSCVLAERKLPVLGMSRREDTLEDVFLELTAEETSPEQDNKEEGVEDDGNL